MEVFFMVFAPRGNDRGTKPYGQPSSDPNKAILSAVKRHFGNNCTLHQMRAQWDFLSAKGFDCKQVISIETKRFVPEWADEIVLDEAP